MPTTSASRIELAPLQWCAGDVHRRDLDEVVVNEELTDRHLLTGGRFPAPAGACLGRCFDSGSPAQRDRPLRVARRARWVIEESRETFRVHR